MGMKAAQIFEKDLVVRVKKALEAGCDMVLLCNQGKDIDHVLDKLEWKQDSDSIKRLLKMHRDSSKNKVSNSFPVNYSHESVKKNIIELKNLVKKLS
jgi:beta-glucosidase-like glycosyl hydrolase